MLFADAIGKGLVGASEARGVHFDWTFVERGKELDQGGSLVSAERRQFPIEVIG